MQNDPFSELADDANSFIEIKPIVVIEEQIATDEHTPGHEMLNDDMKYKCVSFLLVILNQILKTNSFICSLGRF